MIGIVDAIAACEGVHGTGVTFVSARGPGQDLFLDFHALAVEIRRRAAHLRALGLRKGDRVALVIPDGPDFIPLFLGALWAGMVPVPLYPPLSLGKLDAFMDALVGILRVAEPRILATDARIAKVLWGAVGRAPSIEKVVDVKDLAGPAPQDASDAREPTSDSDLAFLQFTSGSTAAPKGVMVTHGNLKANCNAILDALGAKPDDDVAVSWLPLYHDMGLIGCVLCPLIGRIPAVYIPTLAFIKNATLWLETLHKHRGTLTFAPNFAYALVTKRAKPEQIARWDLSRMRGFGCGAEPINPEVIRAFVRTFAPSGLRPEAMLPSYGMAEATLAMAFGGLGKPMHTDRIDASGYHGERKAQPVSNGTDALEIVCCGRPFPGHELSIQDETGRKLPDREVGEICFRGPSVTAGYFRNEEATRAAGMGESGNGWLRTGDLGYVAGGEIYISGRIKDILIVHGRNYYPQAIEWVLDDVPGLRKGSTIVFSRPGRSSEEVVVVAETREKDLEALRAAIVAKVSDEVQLAVADVGFIAPGALPKTSSGKLQRRKTRELYLAGKLPKAGIRPSSTRLLAARHAAVALVGRARHIARGWFR